MKQSGRSMRPSSITSLFIATTFSLMVTGCASLLSKTPSGNEIVHLGAVVEPPSALGWSHSQTSEYGVIFKKSFPDNSESAFLNTYTFGVGEFPSDDKFFEAIKRGRASNNDKTRFRQLAVNYKDVKYQGVPCIQYQGISEDHGTNGVGVGNFSYFQNYGFICRTKLNNWTAILMELSHRSSDREMPEVLHDEAKDFFDSIELIVQ